MKTRPGLQRLLLYSHDTYGLGHLRRNVLIAQDILQHIPGVRVVLLSGSTVTERFDLPKNLTVVPLLPVVKTGVDEYTSRDPRLPFSIVWRARAAIIADVARRFEPDVFLVDHAPQGMKAELLRAFDALRHRSPATRIVLGLRDVVDEPAVVRRTWEAQDIPTTLREVYDRVVVYGSPDLVDLAGYGMPEETLERTTYCGYLCRQPAAQPAVPIPGWTPDMRVVLGTAGGGGDGVDVLLATLEAAERLGLPSLLVTGPLMSGEDRAVLQTRVAASHGGHLEEFVPGLEGAMAAASVVVTMGGYNSLMEAIPSGTPTVVVPRTWPRREQQIRAERFASRGLVRVVDGGSGLEDRLEGALRAALAAARHDASTFDRLGLPRLREVLLDEARASQAIRLGSRGADAELQAEESLAVPA
ncbi:MAG: glycosyltransferase [Chloroflexi bacterium]|nr:glycosyltransferase [Chloroflexota bacterium]